jgi:hypothetical protein
MGEHGVHSLTAAALRRIHDGPLNFSAHSARISVVNAAPRDSITAECDGEPRSRPWAFDDGDAQWHRGATRAATLQSPLVASELTYPSNAVA